MRTGTLFLLSIVILVLSACSKPVPTPSPTPSPTPTPTFEQKRTAVLSYLQAFNGIDNSLNNTVSEIVFSSSGTTVQDLLAAWNQDLGQYIVALNGGLARLSELQAPLIEPDTSSHLNQAKNSFLAIRQGLDDIRQAISTGDQTRIAVANAKLEAPDIEAQASAIYRATEQLLLKYNISDEEVSYRFRGK